MSRNASGGDTLTLRPSKPSPASLDVEEYILRVSACTGGSSCHAWAWSMVMALWLVRPFMEQGQTGLNADFGWLFAAVRYGDCQAVHVLFGVCGFNLVCQDTRKESAVHRASYSVSS